MGTVSCTLNWVSTFFCACVCVEFDRCYLRCLEPTFDFDTLQTGQGYIVIGLLFSILPHSEQKVVKADYYMYRVKFSLYTIFWIQMLLLCAHVYSWRPWNYGPTRHKSSLNSWLELSINMCVFADGQMEVLCNLIVRYYETEHNCCCPMENHHDKA